MSIPSDDGPAGASSDLSAGGLDRLASALRVFRALGKAQEPLTDEPVADMREFGRFRLRKVLGQGKFGIVFLADDPQSVRQVAIKFNDPITG